MALSSQVGPSLSATITILKFTTTMPKTAQARAMSKPTIRSVKSTLRLWWSNPRIGGGAHLRARRRHPPVFRHAPSHFLTCRCQSTRPQGCTSATNTPEMTAGSAATTALASSSSAASKVAAPPALSENGPPDLSEPLT